MEIGSMSSFDDFSFPESSIVFGTHQVFHKYMLDECIKAKKKREIYITLGFTKEKQLNSGKFNEIIDF